MADEWKETRMFLENVTRPFEITLDSAEYLERTGRKYVRRVPRVIKRSAPPVSTMTRSEEWRKLLFQRNYPVEFENEPPWYKVLQSYRPCRSLYDGLFRSGHVEKVDACVQTDFTFVRKCFVLGMESFEQKEKEQTNGIWKMCCCGRQ